MSGSMGQSPVADTIDADINQGITAGSKVVVGDSHPNRMSMQVYDPDLDKMQFLLQTSDSPIHAQSMEMPDQEEQMKSSPAKPYMKKLDFSRLNDTEGAIKNDGLEDSKIYRRDEAVVNMLQNNEELQNSRISENPPTSNSPNKFGYGFQPIPSKQSGEEDQSEHSGQLYARFKEGKGKYTAAQMKIIMEKMNKEEKS